MLVGVECKHLCSSSLSQLMEGNRDDRGSSGWIQDS